MVLRNKYEFNSDMGFISVWGMKWLGVSPDEARLKERPGENITMGEKRNW